LRCPKNGQMALRAPAYTLLRFILKNMGSLIVKLHDVVKDYIKSAKNVDIAGEIGAEVLLRTKEVVKKHMWKMHVHSTLLCFIQL
jgi:hypothetical protein